MLDLLLVGFDNAPECLIIEIRGFKAQLLRFEQFRAQPRPKKLLRRHAVIGDEAHHRERSRAENTHPRQGFRAEIRAQDKIKTHGDAAGQNRKNELPHGQSEKHGFGVVPNLPVNLYFQENPSYL